MIEAEYRLFEDLVVKEKLLMNYTRTPDVTVDLPLFEERLKTLLKGLELPSGQS